MCPALTADDVARALVGAALGVPMAQIGSDCSMFTEPAWDSLAHMRIVLEIEKRLNRSLTTEEIVAITDVKSVHDLLCA